MEKDSDKIQAMLQLLKELERGEESANRYDWLSEKDIWEMVDLYDSAVEYWHKKNVVNGADLAEAFNGKAVAFIYNSGKIENEGITYNDTREIFEHDGVSSYTGDVRALFEIQNAKKAYEAFLTAFDKRCALTQKLILELHLLLTAGTYDSRRWQKGERPGTYKLGDYVTGRNEVGAAPEDVAVELQELTDDLSGAEDKDALTAAAFFHAKFENIHPFSDGNGRLGRLLMNYILVLHNHPPIIIFEDDRKKYYDALEMWDTVQDLEPLKQFLKEETIKTWKNKIED